MALPLKGCSSVTTIVNGAREFKISICINESTSSCTDALGEATRALCSCCPLRCTNARCRSQSSPHSKGGTTLHHFYAFVCAWERLYMLAAPITCAGVWRRFNSTAARHFGQSCYRKNSISCGCVHAVIVCCWAPAGFCRVGSIFVCAIT